MTSKRRAYTIRKYNAYLLDGAWPEEAEDRHEVVQSVCDFFCVLRIADLSNDALELACEFIHTLARKRIPEELLIVHHATAWPDTWNLSVVAALCEHAPTYSAPGEDTEVEVSKFRQTNSAWPEPDRPRLTAEAVSEKLDLLEETQGGDISAELNSLYQDLSRDKELYYQFDERIRRLKDARKPPETETPVPDKAKAPKLNPNPNGQPDEPLDAPVVLGKVPLQKSCPAEDDPELHRWTELQQSDPTEAGPAGDGSLSEADAAALMTAIAEDPRKGGVSTSTIPAAMNVPGYEMLAVELLGAYDQASRYKGHDRHGSNLPFEQQPIMTINRMLGGSGHTFVMVQKIEEAQALRNANNIAGTIEKLRAVMVYAAAAIIAAREIR